MDLPAVDVRRLLATSGGTILALALTTLLVAGLQAGGISNASAVYLLAVVANGVAFGPWAAAGAAAGAFLLYDFLFVQPLYTFTVDDPDEWLNLLLLLLVGIVVGQLAARQRSRAEAALVREREARVLYQVSRALATRAATRDAIASITTTLADQTRALGTWVMLGGDGEPERVIAATGSAAAAGQGPPRRATHAVLRRAPDESAVTWVRVHEPPEPGRPAARIAGGGADLLYRVRVEAAGQDLGSVWTLRAREAGSPSREETRMLAAAADQIGQAVAQDHLAEEALSAEVARRSDALKSALLDSVSHDLRTPLASIRAAAGSLMDPALAWSRDNVRETAAVIDAEAERLNRLVSNFLDLSRIEAGGLRAELEPYPLEDLVETTLRRLRARLGERSVELAIPASVPPVEVDATFMDEILTNLLENGIKYTPPRARVRISAAQLDQATVQLIIEDDGPGVPEAALGRLFEKFYRVERRGEGARRGVGIGLAVVQGLVVAMGGGIAARRSELGGLAICIDLRAAAGEQRPAGTAVSSVEPRA